MWAIAEKIPNTKLNNTKCDPRSFNLDDVNTWTSPTLENGDLLKVVREIQNTGLGTSEQIYLSIVPPLIRRHNERLI
jgi:hypothetical protein